MGAIQAQVQVSAGSVLSLKNLRGAHHLVGSRSEKVGCNPGAQNKNTRGGKRSAPVSMAGDAAEQMRSAASHTALGL